jgi:hypothetical protein
MAAERRSSTAVGSALARRPRADLAAAFFPRAGAFTPPRRARAGTALAPALVALGALAAFALFAARAAFAGFAAFVARAAFAGFAAFVARAAFAGFALFACALFTATAGSVAFEA